MRQPSLNFLLAVALSALLCGATPQVSPTLPAPGTVNYIDGEALSGGQPLEPGMVVKAGQSLTTAGGSKVELLLTPGAFLRIGEKSAIKFNSATLGATELQLDRGRAIVEVDQLDPQTKLRVNLNGAVVRLEAPGLYDLDAGQNQVRVFDGMADVAAYGMRLTLNSGLWLDLNHEDSLVASRFDGTPAYDDDLYEWSSLRSAYLAEANVNAADFSTAPAPSAAGSPAAQDGGAWYWDASYDSYTFIPWFGVSYSPYGWGFYSPVTVHQAPIATGPVLGASPIHRFHLDPGQWGPGRHYTVTRPTAPIPLPPAGYRHTEIPGVRFQAAPGETAQTGETRAGPELGNVLGNTRRTALPLANFRETSPKPAGEPVTRHALPVGHVPAAQAPVMHAEPVRHAEPVLRTEPVTHFQPAPQPQPPPAAPHVSAPPAPAPHPTESKCN